MSLTGIENGGFQFGLQVEDRAGSIKEVADFVRIYGGRMVSILTSYDDVPAGYRKVYIRMHSVDMEKIKELNDSLSEKALLLYRIDHRQNDRRIYSENMT
jgi:acetoin utilization protein AcuB